MKAKAPILDVVVTARPSWARVKYLVLNYAQMFGADNINLLLVGPSVSKRYGDLSEQLPIGLNCIQFPALYDSDELEAVALTCFEGASAVARHWSQRRPDCVLVVADRTETLGIAAAASLMQIPLIHIQGGEISGSIDDKIRDTNSKMADLHLTTNEFTKINLIEMGEPEHLIQVIGCPSLDVVSQVQESGGSLNFTNADLSGVGCNFELSSNFGIIMFHPDTLNEIENLAWVKEIIESIEKSNIFWFWFWPNPDHGTSAISKEIRKSRENGKLERVKFIINLQPEIFVKLALKAKIMIGNSSFGIREASFIGLPVINLGKRQIGRQRASNVLDLDNAEQASLLFDEINKQINKTFKKSFLYGDGNSGMKAAAIIGSWLPTIKLRKLEH